MKIRSQYNRSWASWAGLAFLTIQVTALAAAGVDALWQTAKPESQGFSSAKLEAMRADLAKRRTRALLVIRNDTIVCEWYAPDVAANTKLGTASLAKAVVGGLSLAVALNDGRLTLDDPAAKFIPQWRGDPRKSRITLRQLGSQHHAPAARLAHLGHRGRGG
ncbi:MAG: serine hydrolase [Verrucomicrobia bacterium]|nr:serine hydrolase [Verrucomicrobiota bacterium]